MRIVLLISCLLVLVSLICDHLNLGDVVHVSALGQPIILIGSWEAANQLLSKRGNIYSNRPPAPFNDFVSVLSLCITRAGHQI